MHILITGGSGFIGSHLVGRLLKEGEYVTVIDNYNDFYDPQLKRRNSAQWKSHKCYQEWEGDIVDVSFINNVFKKQAFDVVIHLAARAGVRPSIVEPRLYEQVNVLGTINLLEACKDFGVKKFIFGSSSSVYGRASKVPFSETDALRNPISPYAATKIAGEVLCHTYNALYKTEVVSLRFFTVYGPSQRPEMAIHQFARKILKEEPITIFGDGSSRRDYTYVDDIVDGIMLVLRGSFQDEIFNLGNSRTTELLKLVQLLEQNLHKNAQIVFKPDQPGDVPITYADLTKSKKELGYNPKISIEEGVKRFCYWIKSN